MTEKINSIKELRKFIEEFEKKRDIFSCINPGVKNSRSTSMRNIVRNIFYGAIFGATSVLNVQQKVATFYRKLDLKPVSDSLIHLRLEECPIEEIRNLVYKVVRILSSEGKLSMKLPSGKSLKIGHFDGSKKMTHYAELLALSGSIEMGIDVEPCECAGQEAKAASKLLSRASEHIEIDICTGDGELYNFEFMQDTYSKGVDYFVSVRAEDLRNPRIIEDMESALKLHKLFQSSPEFSEEQKKYQDMIKHEVYFTDEAKYECYTTLTKYPELDHPDVIGKIVKTYIKGEREGSTETHYLISSAITLTPKDFIVIAIEHWAVETMFRTLGREFWSSHSYKKLVVAANILMLLVLLAIGVVQFCKIEVLGALNMSNYARKCLILKEVRDTLRDFVRSGLFRCLSLGYT